MFHVNPETGNAGPCSAKEGNCPFGGTDEHYSSAPAARAAYEQTMATQALIADINTVALRKVVQDFQTSELSFEFKHEVELAPDGETFTATVATRFIYRGVPYEPGDRVVFDRYQNLLGLKGSKLSHP